jgi:hypothetical protein
MRRAHDAAWLSLATRNLFLPHSVAYKPVRATALVHAPFANQTDCTVTDYQLLNLQAIFPRSLVLAALDLIDRQNGTVPPLTTLLALLISVARSPEVHWASSAPLRSFGVYRNVPRFS